MNFHLIDNKELQQSLVTMDGTDDSQMDPPGSRGALMCERPAIPNAIFSESNTQAASNLINGTQAGPRPCCIVGHGLDGMIATGGGTTPDEINQNLDDEFWVLWNQLFDPLAGRATSLKLWGCYVGANSPGSDLLFKLATKLNCPVAAPTGEVQCSGGQISFSAGSVWQVATPALNPIPIPEPQALETSWLSHHIETITIDRAGDAIPLAAIDRAFLSAGRGGSGTGVGNGVMLDNKQASELLHQIDLQHPREIGGALFAQRTGSFQLDYGGKTLQFWILANRLLQNVAQPNVYYNTSIAFQKTARALGRPPAFKYHALYYAWVGEVGFCNEPGGVAGGFQLAIGNRNPSRSIRTTVRVSSYTNATGTTYQDRSDVIGPRQDIIVTNCSQNSLTGLNIWLTLLGAEWA